MATSTEEIAEEVLNLQQFKIYPLLNRYITNEPYCLRFKDFF